MTKLNSAAFETIRMVWLAVAVSACVSVPVRAAFAEECEVKGYRAIPEAESSAWTFSARVMSGEGGCTYTTPVTVISASGDGDGVTCDVTLFAGSKLAPGWALKDISFSGPNVQIVDRDELPSRDMEMKVEAFVPRGAQKNLVVASVLLVGPDCDDWRDAFPLAGGS